MNYKRSLVILVENQDKYDAYTRKDMTRWWRGHCKHHQRDGELYIEVTYPIRSTYMKASKGWHPLVSKLAPRSGEHSRRTHTHKHHSCTHTFLACIAVGTLATESRTRPSGGSGGTDPPPLMRQVKDNQEDTHVHDRYDLGLALRGAGHL